jgi:hypothetical protein
MTGDNEPESLAWSVRPYQQAPKKRWVILIVAFAAMAFGTCVIDKPLLGAVGFVVIIATTMDFWLGTSYKVDRQGASSRTGLSYSSIAWEDVKRVVVGPNGVKVSPLEDGSSRMDEFRGVLLKTNPENREQVVEAVRKLGGSHVRFMEG